MDDEKDQPDELPDNVIEFPRERIVRWPKRFNREELRRRVKAIIDQLLDLIDVA